MGTGSSAGYGSWFPAWLGFAAGLCLVLPTLLKLRRESWTEADIFFMAAGTTLAFICVARLAAILRSIKAQEAKAGTDGPETP